MLHIEEQNGRYKIVRKGTVSTKTIMNASKMAVDISIRRFMTKYFREREAREMRRHELMNDGGKKCNIAP